MATNNISKNRKGYGYKYADIAQIHEYLEEINTTYYQYVDTDSFGNDYIMTVPIVDGKELPARRGCRVVQAVLQGKENPAQEQGSALTYARRYSLLMAFGLATEDDDAQSLTRQKPEPWKNPRGNEMPQTDNAERDVLMIQLVNKCTANGINPEAVAQYYISCGRSQASDFKSLEERWCSNALKYWDELIPAMKSKGLIE